MNCFQPSLKCSETEEASPHQPPQCFIVIEASISSPELLLRSINNLNPFSIISIEFIIILLVSKCISLVFCCVFSFYFSIFHCFDGFSRFSFHLIIFFFTFNLFRFFTQFLFCILSTSAHTASEGDNRFSAD